MVKGTINIDAASNPRLFRKVFSAAVGVDPLPEHLAARDDRSGKQIVEDIASKIGISMPEATRLVGKVMQREILTEGAHQRLRKSFTGSDSGRLPSFTEVMDRASTFRNSTERSEFARQAIADGRIKDDPFAGFIIDHGATSDKINEFISWAEADPTKVQNPQGSAWHKLASAYHGKRILTALGRKVEQVGTEHDQFFSADPQVFVIQHNWAAAFSSAKDFDGGDAPFPFEHCAFEMMISDRRVIMVTKDVSASVPIAAIYLDINGAMWIGSQICPFGDFQNFIDKSSKFNIVVHDTIRALCIALDAEVAVTEVVRAPHRLNHQREKQGKKPILDHHVINLARRSRVEALPAEGQHEARWHPRLHFRRGHWRHFETHRTWIKWMLVGNPDLGFIDKEYRA